MVLEQWDNHVPKDESRHRPYTLLKTVKLLEGDVGENLDHLEYSNAFLDITPKT